jgi:hypothetical protein
MKKIVDYFANILWYLVYFLINTIKKLSLTSNTNDHFCYFLSFIFLNEFRAEYFLLNFIPVIISFAHSKFVMGKIIVYSILQSRLVSLIYVCFNLILEILSIKKMLFWFRFIIYWIAGSETGKSFMITCNLH